MWIRPFGRPHTLLASLLKHNIKILWIYGFDKLQRPQYDNTQYLQFARVSRITDHRPYKLATFFKIISAASHTFS